MRDKNRTSLPAPNVEPHLSHAPLAAEEVAGSYSLVDIRVISYRKRTHDPDGISIKAVLDGIVRAGILLDDSTKHVRKVSFESIKSDEEKTVIEIRGLRE